MPKEVNLTGDQVVALTRKYLAATGQLRLFGGASMIHIDRKGVEDETIIAIQRASFKAVYEKYQDQYWP